MAAKQFNHFELDSVYNNVLNKMRSIKHNKSDLYLKLSYGTKSMIMLLICLEAGIKFKCVFGDSERHSDKVNEHINNINNLLEKNGIEIITIPCTCTKKLGGHGCPAISAVSNYIDSHNGMGIGTLSIRGLKNIIDVYGEIIVKNSTHQNTESFYKKHSANPNRLNPLWKYSPEMISAMHDRFVPDKYKFPKNSVATCNSPICPSIFALNPHLRTKYNDWTE